jgi:trehalose/maltose hydrolase-like predicted phosphorylase
LKINLFNSTRQERLKELGITSCHISKRRKSKKLKAQWQSQMEILVDYKRINGDCSVPHHYENDRSLGIWVSNRQRKYTQMKDGKTVMDPDRMEKLEELGFEWSWYDSKRKFKKKAKKDEQQTNQVDAQTLADL